VSIEEAAHGIRAVANAAMAGAVRAVTVERGRDPRDLTLVAIGGNGGIHGVDVARQLGVRKIVIPPFAGVFSAVGMLAADVEYTALSTVMRLLDAITPAELGQMMDGLAAEVSARLASEGYQGSEIELSWQAEVRHEGQASELSVPFEATGSAMAQIRQRFVAEYVKTYGYRDDTPLELVKITVVGRGLRRNRLDFGAMRIEQRPAAARSGFRLVAFTRGAPAVETEIVPRIAVGTTPRRGPLIIEEFDATVLVPPDTSVATDAAANIVLDIGGSA
jgi:N-methylhydantoinase A